MGTASEGIEESLILTAREGRKDVNSIAIGQRRVGIRTGAIDQKGTLLHNLRQGQAGGVVPVSSRPR